MPLVDLITDLKSLKYGKDTPGGGYSGQPYIQAKIPDGFTTKSPDFFLRNGFLAPFDALEDIKRLGKMFGDLKSPNGVLFIAKQNVLSNSAVRTQTSGILNEGIYTPLNTLAQAGVVAFGGHLNKQGINPFALSGAYAPNEYLYYNKINKDNLDWLSSGGATSLDNRLFALYESRILNNEIGTYAKPNNINVDLKNTILTYRGGPGSILGVGNTDIRFEDNGNKRTGVNNVQLINSGFFGKKQQLPIPTTPFFINVIETPKNPAAGNFDVFKRPNSRTTGLFISPYGVSNAYESATNELLPQGPNGAGVVSLDGGYTFDLSFYNNVYNTGSLTPYDPVVNSQKIRPNNRTTGSFISPYGVSNAYESATNKLLPLGSNGEEVISSNGGYTFNPGFQYNVYTQGNTFPENSDLINANNTFTYNQIDLINQPKTEGKLAGSPQIQDFRAILRDRLGGFKNKQGKTSSEVGATPLSLDYQTQNIEKRVNIGGINGPGARANNDYSSYTKGVIGPGRTGRALDKINALPIYSSDTGPRIDSEVTDLITFRIGAINNLSPNVIDYMHFRAFINSFTDNYTGDWGGYNYLGRGEKFYTYNGFDRKISLSFTAAAQSKEELIPMYKKLNYLASNLAPDYSGTFGYMKGCFITLTVGGYLYEQPGFITNLSYDIITDMPWEIAINDTNGNQDPTVKQLSHMVKVGSFDFTPIHNFIPRKPLIGLGDDITPDNPKGWVQESDVEYIALANPNDGSTNWSILGSVNLR